MRRSLGLPLVFILISAALAASQTVSIESPGKGEILNGGLTHRITWESTNDINFVSLHYRLGGGDWTTIRYCLKDRGGYDWEVPRISAEGAVVRVQGWDGCYSDKPIATDISKEFRIDYEPVPIKLERLSEPIIEIDGAELNPMAGIVLIVSMIIAGLVLMRRVQHMQSRGTIEEGVPRLCPNCGIHIEPEDRYCQRCGHVLK